jgi:hypothetical protein
MNRLAALPPLCGTYTPAWFSRIEETRRGPADLRLFAAPSWLDTQPGGTPAVAHAFVATLHFVPPRLPPGLVFDDRLPRRG